MSTIGQCSGVLGTAHCCHQLSPGQDTNTCHFGSTDARHVSQRRVHMTAAMYFNTHQRPEPVQGPEPSLNPAVRASTSCAVQLLPQCEPQLTISIDGPHQLRFPGGWLGCQWVHSNINARHSPPRTEQERRQQIAPGGERCSRSPRARGARGKGASHSTSSKLLRSVTSNASRRPCAPLQQAMRSAAARRAPTIVIKHNSRAD